tara:strand:+ start:74 stop:631 length:558 start_codon:yes stop_codon:yes gene_type:complete
MTRSTFTALSAIAILTLSASAATAAPPAQTTGSEPAMQRADLLARLVACRSMADTTARLSCYDVAAAALDAAERQGDVVVVDRNQISTARRENFGFSLPSLPNLFERGGQPESVTSIDSTLVSARENWEGRWTFTLADGSVWQQIDTAYVSFRNRGNPQVTVRSAALGSFLLVVGDSRAVRVRRQ